MSALEGINVVARVGWLRFFPIVGFGPKFVGPSGIVFVLLFMVVNFLQVIL